MSSTTLPPSTVVELRRYTLHPGRRDELIELFDAEFIETQEDVGIEVIGQFRDDDSPDTFTWLRGFADLASRRRALTAFYGGPCWATHRKAANATMIDCDDVLLLTPVAGHGFARSPRVVDVAGERPIDVVTFHVDGAPSTAMLDRLCAKLGETEAVFVTLDVENDFPALPVREGEQVIVAVSRWIGRSWHELGAVALGTSLLRTEVLRLRPTQRSRLR